MNFRTRLIEHDYTACCPQFNVGNDLPRNHIGLCDGVLFAVALKSDWVGLCVPKIRFGVDAASGRRKLAS